MGLNDPHPRFSFALIGDGRNRRMTGYQIVAGTDPAKVAMGIGDLWDSGRVESERSRLIRYGGRELRSHLTVHWSVRVWDEKGVASPYAPLAMFDTGLLGAGNWAAAWISRPDFDPRIGRMAPTASPYDNPYQARPADYFRRTFSIGGKVRRARLYATALGLYEAYLNGQRLGDDLFSPGWTDYYTRIEYQLYDVTALLGSGVNVLGFITGEGWYSGRVANTLKRQGAHYGPKPALICQLLIEFEDGHTETIGTDMSWAAFTGPIVYSDFLMGEKYDARLDRPGWALANYDAAAWWPVELTQPYPRAPQFDAPRSPPIRRTAEIPARFLHRSSSGGAIFDVGQNIAGFVRFEFAAKADGQYVLRHAEALEANGDLHVVNLRSAAATDIYIAAADGPARYEPRFTFHGFRYVEVSGPEFDPSGAKITGIQINSDLPVTGAFSSGHEGVNQLYRNIVWSQRGNFLAVPTDCPQRDERLGWLADAQIFWPTASFNMDVAAFFAKWMRDIADTQFDDGAFTDVAPSKPHWSHRPFPAKGAPAWGDGAVILVWHHYCFYDDRDLVAAYWPALVRWMDYIERHNPSLIRVNQTNNNYGDWLSLGPVAPKALVATAYWAYLADLMARLAPIAGDPDRAASYAALRQSIERAFAERFVAADGRIEGDTQTGYLLALDFGLLDAGAAEQAKVHLRRVLHEADDHLATGFLGVRHLCPVLAEIGETDLAYGLLLNEDFPSWLFPVVNGATTIWERWDGWTPERGFQSSSMNSLNHYAYGAVGEWLLRRVAGIDCDPEAPGFARVICRPLPDERLGHVEASYLSAMGRIAAAWRTGDGRVRYRLSLPPNTRGVIELPVSSAAAVLLDGASAVGHRDVDRIVERDGVVELVVGSGDWAFEWLQP